jgi:hypothetical protein
MESIENEYVTFWIEDGIMYGKYKPHVVIDLNAAMKVAEDRLKLANNKDYPFMGFLDGISSATKEARDFFSNGDGIKHMKKLALMTNSPISKMAGNFFLRISKPAVPTSLFTNKEDAIRWLKDEK